MATRSKDWPEINPARTIVFRPNGPSEINKKVARLFENVKVFPLKRIVMQFWRPKTTPSGQVLICSGLPYALSLHNDRLLKYRSACVIHRAPAVYAATDRLFTQLVKDLSVYRGTNTLVDVALECDLTCIMMVPVFTPDCLFGVIEVSVSGLAASELVAIFNELHLQLQKEGGLGIVPPTRLYYPRPPFMDMVSILPATCEAQQAVAAVVARSHAITLGQFWIPYNTPTQQVYLLRSSSFCHVGSSVSLLYEYLRVLPLEMVQVLVRMALETHRPHFCRNIGKLTRDQKGMLALLPSSPNESYASFVICLRSSHAEQQDYLLEFFWPQTSDHLAMIKDILSTLKENFPSFKYASGAQLGDELHDVADMDSSSSGTPPKAATRASDRLKRKFDADVKAELLQDPPLTNIDSQEEAEADDDLAMLLVYKADCKLVYLPNSATFEDVMETIKRELNPVGTYKVEYQVGRRKWYSLRNDTCFKRCISAFQKSKNIDYIKFHVLAVEE